MDLKSLTQELKKLLALISGGNLTTWNMLRLAYQIIHFVLQFDPSDTPDPTPDGKITFGAAPIDAMEFSAMVDELCVALGAPPENELEAMGGIADMIAERALAKLAEAVRNWFKAQGFDSLVDFVLNVLTNVKPVTPS